MASNHSAPILEMIPLIGQLPYQESGAIVVAAGLAGTTWVARRQLVRAAQGADGALVPEPKLTYRNFFEILAESLYKLAITVMGDQEAKRIFPIVGSLFVFIFSCNLLGLIPGFLPPTDNLNTTLAVGLFVFLFYNFIGLKTHGWSYLKHFMGPVIWLAPLMFLIEVISHVVRPLSLALRLRGNIMGDHMVLSVFSEMIPFLVPVAFYGLGVFVSFMQAFVFCLLTMVYISLSAAHDH